MNEKMKRITREYLNNKGKENYTLYEKVLEKHLENKLFDEFEREGVAGFECDCFFEKKEPDNKKSFLVISFAYFNLYCEFAVTCEGNCNHFFISFPSKENYREENFEISQNYNSISEIANFVFEKCEGISAIDKTYDPRKKENEKLIRANASSRMQDTILIVLGFLLVAISFLIKPDKPMDFWVPFAFGIIACVFGIILLVKTFFKKK